MRRERKKDAHLPKVQQVILLRVPSSSLFVCGSHPFKIDR
jgi:hypothetical protein